MITEWTTRPQEEAYHSEVPQGASDDVAAEAAAGYAALGEGPALGIMTESERNASGHWQHLQSRSYIPGIDP